MTPAAAIARAGASAGEEAFWRSGGARGVRVFTSACRCRGAVAGGEPCPDAEAAAQASGGGGEPCRDGAAVGGGVAGALGATLRDFRGRQGGSDGDRATLTPVRRMRFPLLLRRGVARRSDRLGHVSGCFPARPSPISSSDVRKNRCFPTFKVRCVSAGRSMCCSDPLRIRCAQATSKLATWGSVGIPALIHAKALMSPNDLRAPGERHIERRTGRRGTQTMRIPGWLSGFLENEDEEATRTPADSNSSAGAFVGIKM